jgi:hypothetical protein
VPHWFFDYPSLLQAYFTILDERGREADWYRRREEYPLPYERGYTINGTGAREFHRMVAERWTIIDDGFRRTARSGHPLKRALKNLCKRSGLGGARELFPIAYVLQKP